jgi:hypothetical protein
VTGLVARDVGGAWHVLEGTLADPPAPLAALAAHRALGGFAKLALGLDGTWQARAELPLDVGAVHAERRAESVAALTALLATGVHAEPPGGRSAARPPSLENGIGEVAARCREIAWPSRRLDPETLAIDLGLRGVRPARVATVAATGAVRAWVELDRVCAPLDPRCERALALLLLRAAAVVRLVRPVLERGATHAVVAFEAAHAGPLPEPLELAHAFAALRVAAETTSRAVRVLARDPALAAAYLRLHGRDDDRIVHPVGPPGSTQTAGGSAG